MDEQKIRQQAEQIVEKVKALVKDGGGRRIFLKRKGETLLNISLGAGLLGTVIGLTAAPFAVLTTALISFGLDCEIETERKDGTVINLNDTALGARLENLKEEAKGKIREKTGGIFGGEPPVAPDDDDIPTVDD